MIMPLTLTMPKLSPTMESGTIVKWHKKEGEFAEIGDVLMDVATDKATVEYQAIDSGWLRKIIVTEGQEAKVNQPIAIFTEEEKESIEGYQVPKQEIPKVEENKEEKEAGDKNEGETVGQTVDVPQKKSSGGSWQQPSFTPEVPLEGYRFEYPREMADKRILSSPLARKVAKEKGLDLSTVRGTGPNGRVMTRDLEKAQSAGIVNFGHREIPEEIPGSYEEVALTPMRKVIGQRLQESKSFIPHFYVTHVVDAEALMSVREQLKNGDIKVSVNDFIVRACALALKQHPEINRGFNSVNQAVIQFKTVDIAVAVSVDQGLITPIVRHADFKNLGELSVEIRTLAQRAKEGKLEVHEYKGGSFTISNLGMHGVVDFQAIINPPQAAILAIGGIQDVPVVKGGVVVPGKTMQMTLSVDHRVIDGVAAALFLKTLKKYLENPALLVLG